MTGVQRYWFLFPFKSFPDLESSVWIGQSEEPEEPGMSAFREWLLFKHESLLLFIHLFRLDCARVRPQKMQVHGLAAADVDDVGHGFDFWAASVLFVHACTCYYGRCHGTACWDFGDAEDTAKRNSQSQGARYNSLLFILEQVSQCPPRPWNL